MTQEPIQITYACESIILFVLAFMSREDLSLEWLFKPGVTDVPDTTPWTFQQKMLN